MLERRLPARAVVERALNIFTTAAGRRSAGGSVGPRISTVVVPANLEQPFEARYYSDVNASVVYLPDQVIIRSAEPAIGILAPKLEQHGPPGHPGAIVVPRRPRNAPCPCGSGRKYKRCHGESR